MSPNQPTIEGFQSFITNVMNVPSDVLDPVTSPVVGWCFGFAQEWVYRGLQKIPSATGAWSIYTMAVYNLAADTLINWAQDAVDAPVFKDALPYWEWLRNKYGVSNFVAGVVQSTSDGGTSVSYLVPQAFSELTIANLGNLKTPYGRTYLGLAQSWGTVWGLS